MSVLRMFKPLPVVREVFRLDTLPDLARAAPRDTITLGWEERLKARARRRSDAGTEFGTALRRGTVLRQDDCLVLTDVVVVVAERLEPVFVIRPATGAEWGLFAYQIGNSHQPLMIADDALVCPDVPGMRLVLEHHGIPFAPGERPFTPTAAVAGHEHVPAERP
jgi:urease accessory protein UreE